MRREDFIFTIGYQGNAAVVDTKAKKTYGKLSTIELAQKGLYKPAFSSALYSQNEQEKDALIAFLNERFGSQTYTEMNLKRLFGVHGVPEGVDEVILI